MCIEIAFQRVPEVETVNDINHHIIAWVKINQAGKNEYSTVTETNLQSVHIPCEALSCKDVECTNVTHRNDRSKFYNDIVQGLCEGGDVVSNNTYCRNVTTNTARNNCRPGWNDHVDELHQMARDKFVVWVNKGKPRHGLIFNDMKNTRARFKYGLRILKQHKNQIISNSLAAKLQQTRPDHFWREINRLHSSKMPTPNCIDGVTGAGT